MGGSTAAASTGTDTGDSLVSMQGRGDRDEQLDRVLIGGRERREIRVEPYSDEWRRLFDRERERIESALGTVWPPEIAARAFSGWPVETFDPDR